MLGFRELSNALRRLEIDPARPVIVHASLSSLGEVHGGPITVLGAFMEVFQTVVMPAFTYKTMVIPEAGPPDNATDYGIGKNTNRMAEFFQPDMPADPLMGVLSETLRRHPAAQRSDHPILSFAGINASRILAVQSLESPLEPIRVLGEEQGWVLLVGVDHTVNTSIHYAEKMAGRKQFTRWALTSQGIVTCPGFPGCSDGFQAASAWLEGLTRRVLAGDGVIQAVPVLGLLESLRDWILQEPLVLLCHRLDCRRCNAVRATYPSSLDRSSA